LYKVALIQNQSEMSHYGYADARPLFEEYEYRTELYTSQNIDELSSDLIRLKFDAIVFASNALNDKTIRERVMSNEFRTSFEVFIKNGKGCLILHQLRLAQDGIPLGFLPNPLNIIQPRVRADKGNSQDNNLYLTQIAKEHVFFLYPHIISIDEIKSRCLSHRSLRGLYWHYWDNLNGVDWNILLYDTDQQGLERPLIIASKESEIFRIALCSLTLDWQKQKTLLKNILTYIIEGKHHLAILRDSPNMSFGFEYFIESLKAQKYPFGIYDVNQNLDDFQRNIERGVHTIIIFGPFVNKEKINDSIISLINEKIQSGSVKLLTMSSDTYLRGFYTSGREKFAQKILHEVELKLQWELSSGYIDGSFGSTVESLQILNDLSAHTRSKYDNQLLRKVIDIINDHDRNRNGSYDEVFGVTCSLLWMRAIYLGADNEDTKRTINWIRENLGSYEDRERILAYYTMIDTGLAKDEEIRTLRNLLLSQQGKWEKLSELDLIVYLKSAIKSRTNDIIIPIIKALEENQKIGFWVDLATTASAVSALLDAQKLLKQEYSQDYSRMREILEPMIFKSIIYIHASMENISETKIYPWDNKASTSLKCIQAWLNFENLIDLPVRELLDALKIYSIGEISKSSINTSLTILEELRNENRDLIEKNFKLHEKLQKQYKSIDITSRYKVHIIIAFLISSYLIMSFIIYSYFIGLNTPLNEIIAGFFVRGLIYHLAFLTLLATIFAGIPAWKRRSSGEMNNE
jgi:hypothetical protein